MREGGHFQVFCHNWRDCGQSLDRGDRVSAGLTGSRILTVDFVGKVLGGRGFAAAV